MPDVRSWSGCAVSSVLIVFAVLAAPISPAAGDDAPASQPVAGSLAERQSLVRDRVTRLEDRMFQLSQALRKSEPDKAARLLDGLGRLRGDQVRDTIAKIVKELESNQLSDAANDQQEVISKLQSLLKELVEEPSQLDERKDDIERVEAIRRSLESLIKEQEEAIQKAESVRAAQRRAEALEAAAQRIDDLLKRQRDSSARTAAEGDLATEAMEQARLRGETEAVAEAVASLAEVDSVGSGADRPGDTETSESASSSNDFPANEPSASKAAESLGRASDAMESAEKSMRGNSRTEAQASQSKAEEALNAAREELTQRADQIRRKLQLEEQAEEQRQTAEKTAELGEQMSGKGAAAESGAGQQGRDGRESGESPERESGDSDNGGGENEATPGQQDVQQAVPFQRDAADQLEKKNADKAIEQQEKAVEKLKKAQEELEDRMDQLRKEQQEEMLAALESRFRAMLSRQLECNKVTTRLGELGAANWKRSDQLELADVSQRQRWVGDQAEETLLLLKEDGSTVILPTMIEEIRDDARDVADRLAAADAGESVRITQSDIESMLRDMIEAIERKQEELADQADSGQSGDGSQPLLPGSAELKLLRSCQIRVNRATQQLKADRERSEIPADDLAKRLRRLAEKQQSVADMAKAMHESLRRAQ
ncbi:MAG: hypothetical protein KF841_06805 [Phycisphaerae bacterium]|nr:hypothetical protein [Phycisphaerae bacterium]